jgi:NAD/NADP transhydrogenase beta subunit
MPDGFDSMGKMLMLLGTIIVVLGAVWHLGGKIINFGKLPGDIHIERENFTFHFPIVTSIIISIILSFVLKILLRK